MKRGTLKQKVLKAKSFFFFDSWFGKLLTPRYFLLSIKIF